MKILWTLLIFLFFNVALSGQAIIAGTINQTTAKRAILYSYPTTSGSVGETIKTTLEKGRFQFEINPLKAVPAILKIAEFECLLFLFPDKTLQINIQIDEQNRPLITFEGTAAVDNHFYSHYQNILIQEKKNLPQELLEKFRPKDYLSYQTNLKQKKTAYLYKHQSKIEEPLFTWLKNDIIYQCANNLFDYPNRKFITRTPPKKYYHFLEDLQLNNDRAILQPTYQRFLLNYTNYQLFKPQKWGLYATLEKEFEFVRRYFFGDVLYYLQFFILKKNLKFDESTKVEKAYLTFLSSNAPEGLKKQLRQAHQLPNQGIIGQVFPINFLKNQHGTYFNDYLKEENAKLFYVCTTPVESGEIAFIQQLSEAISSKKYIDFGLIGLLETIEFPKELERTPYFWIVRRYLEAYLKRIPITKNSYLIFVNKHGQIMEYTTWTIDQTSTKEIVDFMIENYNRRTYSTLSNSNILRNLKIDNHDN